MSVPHLPTGTRYYEQTRIGALLRYRDYEHHIWRPSTGTWEPTMYILDYWAKGDMDTEDLSEEEARARWPDAF